MADNFTLCLTGLVAFTVFLSAVSGQQTYPSPGGKHCFFCPPGTFVEEHCTEDLTNSACSTCPAHHYSDKPNQREHCDQCKSECPKNGKVITDCTAKTNKQCLCHDGFHKFPLDKYDPHYKCEPHSKCGKGEGEVYYGNHTHDTKCQKCTKGMFVNKTDPGHPVCENCSQCDPDEEVLSSCTMENDTRCGSQHHDNVTVTETSVVTSTIVPNTADTGGGSSLSEGKIIGIIFGIIIILNIIVVVITAIYIRRRYRNEGDIRSLMISRDGNSGLCWHVMITLGIIFLGIILSVKVIYKIYRERTQDATRDEDAGVREGMLNDGTRANNPDSGDTDSPGPNGGHQGNGDTISLGAWVDRAGSGHSSPAAPDQLPPNAAESSGQVAGADEPLAPEWNPQYIAGRVFPLLSDQLGTEWTFFILQLKGEGWADNARAIMDHKRQEETTIKNCIYKCLVVWSERCPGSVTRKNILDALEAPSVNRKDLRERFENLTGYD